MGKLRDLKNKYQNKEYDAQKSVSSGKNTLWNQTRANIYRKCS